MLTNSIQAYEAVNRSTMSGFEIEAAVLTKAARKLKECQDSWNADDHNSKLDRALKFNQRIWSIFQGELSREDNPLPRKLKINLLSLSAFIDRRIFEIIANPSPEKLTIIININNNIAAGLRTRPSTNRPPESDGI